MAVFVDTSAILALLDTSVSEHQPTVDAFRAVTDAGQQLVTHNYVIVEAIALVARRLGMGAVRTLEADVIPDLTVAWVDEALHETAMGAFLAMNRRQLSLVDCVSFAVMRKRDIRTALVIDRHFAEQGFTCLP